jgi:hypothetical protein
VVLVVAEVDQEVAGLDVDLVQDRLEELQALQVLRHAAQDHVALVAIGLRGMIAAAEVEVEYDLDLLLLAELADEAEVSEGVLEARFHLRHRRAGRVEDVLVVERLRGADGVDGDEELRGVRVGEFDLRHRRSAYGQGEDQGERECDS